MFNFARKAGAQSNRDNLIPYNTMKATDKKAQAQAQAQVNTQAQVNVQALTLPTKAVTLAEYVKTLLEQRNSLTAIKQARKEINANLAEYSQEYGYKEVIAKCKALISAYLDNRAEKAMRDLTYNNVLQAVAPLVMNTQEYKDIATSALKAGALEYSNPIEFCQKYFSAVTAEGVLLVAQSYITGDRKYIASLYVAKNLTAEVAVSIFKQAFRNFDRVSRCAYGVGRNLNNVRIEGALTGKIYEAVQEENGTYARGEEVQGLNLSSADFIETLTGVNAQVRK